MAIKRLTLKQRGFVKDMEIKQIETKDRYDKWIVDGYMSDMIGWNFVYLLHNSGFYKIGHSNRPFDRTDGFQIGNPNKVELIQAVRVKDAPQIEHKLHKKFLFQKKRGEWFRLDMIQVEWIFKFLLNQSNMDLKNYGN